MRPLLLTLLCTGLALRDTRAQTATGQVFLKEGGPLGYTTVSIVSQGRQLLTNERGRFVLLNLPAGEVRLRFKRIGFVPKDTTLAVAANDTARIRIDMTRLVIQLPAMLVSGKCTTQTPLEIKTGFLTELLDQVSQNAERMELLAVAKPFLIKAASVGGWRNRDGRFVPIRFDTVVRGPLPTWPYEPKRIMRPGEGAFAGSTIIKLPELPDFADTAFTNNHCFRYGGLTRFDSDSVIAVDFEPVPWLDKEVDITGTLYLRVDGYQLVGSFTRLNRITPAMRRSNIEEYSVRAHFREIVPGVPVLEAWELINWFKPPRAHFVQTGQLIDILWKDSTATKRDTVPRRP